MDIPAQQQKNLVLRAIDRGVRIVEWLYQETVAFPDSIPAILYLENLKLNLSKSRNPHIRLFQILLHSHWQSRKPLITNLKLKQV